jgi:DNA-binding SARP family transcriptional activator/regulation of enolase protein 1 (concanavalin A-like superfamily)
MAPKLRIDLLGGCRVLVGDRLLEAISSPRLQSFLAYLLLHRGTPQTRQHIAFTFWPDSTEPQARTNLRKLLYDLRQALPQADAFVQADDHTIRWLTDAPYTFDVAAFEDALAEAEQAETPVPPALRQALERAVDLYAGDLLPSCYDDWIHPYRERLRAGYRDALERLAQLLEETRDLTAAIGYAQRLLRQDPLHEPAYRRLMRLYALQGDRAGALHVYHSCVTVLERELGVAPGENTQRAYEQLLEAEAAAPPSALATGKTGTVPETPAAPLPGLVASAPLVGRHPEWAQLLAAWRHAKAGAAHLVLIEGEAGIGKSRLAGELTRWLTRQGIQAAAARCYAAEGALPYAPVTAWLRDLSLAELEPVWLGELARLLPELLAEHPGLEPPRPVTEPWQRQRLFEALARAALGTGRPVLLVLDDLQWCDADTREWLHYLLRCDPRAPLLVLATVRSEELHEQHPLRRWIQALHHDGKVTEIELDRLDEADTLALAENMAGHNLAPELASCLYRETAGNPLFVVEMVRAGLAVDELEPACPLQALPPRVQGAIEARLGQLSGEAQSLAEIAAVVGRSFSLELLLASTAMEEDTAIVALDELWQRRVVVEGSEAAYDFTHDKLREVAYAGLSPVRRKQLHGRVAGALGRVHRDALDEVSAQIAVHYDRAGQFEQALPYYLRAAQVAQRVYANQEAIQHYRRALDLLEISAGPRRARLEALEGLGSLLHRSGQVAEAERHLRHAVALGHEMALSPDRMAPLYYWLGETLFWQARAEDALSLGREGLARLGADRESAAAAVLHHMVATAYIHRQDLQRWREASYRAAAFLDRLPYTEELLPVYKDVAAVHQQGKQVEEALRWAQLLRERASAHHDLRAVCHSHIIAGHTLALTGDWHAAASTFQEGLESARQIDEVEAFASLCFGLSEAALSIGQVDAAANHVEEVARRSETAEGRFYGGVVNWLLGRVALAQNEPGRAVERLEEAAGVYGSTLRIAVAHSLGQAYLAHGEREQAVGWFTKALDMAVPLWPDPWLGAVVSPLKLLVLAPLGGLEEAFQDLAAYQAFCQHFHEEHPQSRGWLDQWYLEPAEQGLGGLAEPPRRVQRAPLSPEWAWIDPHGDCSYVATGGLEIHAANGRDLWHINLSAPRLVCPASGDLILQAACRQGRADRPALGGLLLWKDEQNYLRLVWGLAGSRDVAFTGCIENRDRIFGRGRLPSPPSPHVLLRLERVGSSVRALCSIDGAQWYTAGQVRFPASDPVQVGLHAVGSIDRGVYHGAFPKGTAIRFAGIRHQPA